MKSVLTSALVALLALPAAAQEYSEGLSSATILKGWRQADGTHMAAVEIKLEKNWKTYWRVAGGGGIPPLFDWSASTNIASVEYLWPAPSIYEEYGLRLVGYKDSLVLPIVLHPVDATQSMQIDAGLQIGVCDDVCIPVETRLQSDLPKFLTHDKAQIDAALAQQAKMGNATDHDLTCHISQTADGFEIKTDMRHPQDFPQTAFVFVEYPTDDWIAQGKTHFQADRLATSATIFSESLESVAAEQLVMTVLAHQQALEITGCQVTN
ncbi:MAG: protein-disulfide reductase DsbD domain-containing protein [Pseudomonadota bacterium]